MMLTTTSLLCLIMLKLATMTVDTIQWASSAPLALEFGQQDLPQDFTQTAGAWQ